jgi:hypothetical protein
MTLALLLAMSASAAPKPAPCADPRAALPGLVARALEDGEDKSTAPPQEKVLGRRAALRRLVFDGEPAYVLDVVLRPRPDGEPEAASLLLTRVEHAPGALHRELYAATLKGGLEAGAAFSDRLDEEGKTAGAPTLQQPLKKSEPATRKAFASALLGLCRESRGLSAQERLLESR